MYCTLVKNDLLHPRAVSGVWGVGSGGAEVGVYAPGRVRHRRGSVG